MKNKSNQSGMTLLEVLIYTAMLIVLLSAIIQSVLVLSTHYRAVRNTRDIEDSALTALGRLVREARNADDISASSTPSGTNPSNISLISRDTSGNSTTTTFAVLNNKLVIYENGVYMGPLTKESVTVIGFQVDHINTGRSKALRIQLGLQSDQATPAVISATFFDTVVLRGSY